MAAARSRTPRLACGVFGLKPRAAHLHAPALGASGPVSTTKRVITEASGTRPRCSDSSPGGPRRSVRRRGAAAPVPPEVGVPPGRLRIAFTKESLFGRSTDPECAAAVEGRRPAPRGARPRDDRGPAGLLARRARARVPRRGGVRDRVGRWRTPRGSRAGAPVRGTSRRRPGRSRRPARPSRLAISRWRDGDPPARRRTVASFFATHDLFLTSTTALRPLPLGRSSRPGSSASRCASPPGSVPARSSRSSSPRWLPRSFDATGNTMLFNQSGQPAMSLPLHGRRTGSRSACRSPGASGRGGRWLRLAAQIEQARPWSGRSPSL